jgi:protein tyrosine phosphatase (PTP) superfamily phosphohydrolase (DUF442 family)
MGNVHVASQTTATAEVRTQLSISNAYPDGRFVVFTSGTCNASLEKRNGKWTVTRSYIEVDAMAPPSEVPEYPGIEFNPDVRAETSAQAATTAATPEVETISRFKYLYRFGNFYVGGQPPLEELQWLKERGVTTIVNLRTEEELRGYAEEAYDEKAVAEKLGFIYRALPVNGIQGYTPENLQKFIGLIDPSAQTLIQCRTAYRATDFFVAYLIRTGDYSVKEALDIGQKMKMVLPLAKLLGQDFEIILKD